MTVEKVELQGKGWDGRGKDGMARKGWNGKEKGGTMGVRGMTGKEAG